MSFRRMEAVYVGTLAALVIAAVVGLITLHDDSTPGQPSAASAVTTNGSGETSANRAPPAGQFKRVTDRLGDTTGPDLAGLAAAVVNKSLQVRVNLATTITDDVTIQLFIDADTDRTTGSLSFPCSAATLGVDYVVTIHDGHVSLMASTADGCQKAFRAVRGAAPKLHVSPHAVDVRVPTAAIHPPGEHVLAMYAEAMRAGGGQIDFCPGQHDRPLTVRYGPGTRHGR